MEIVRPMAYYENLKRYLKRRKYQKLYVSNYNNNNRRKLKIVRLGDGTSPRRQWKIVSSNNKPKLMCVKRIFSSPMKIFTKFHDTYVDVMTRLAGSVAHKSSGAGAFSGKKVAKSKQISMVCCGEELVDSKMVLEIYKRLLASSRQLDGVCA